MRWRRGHRSEDVIDRRGSSGRRRIPGGKGGLGLGGILLILVLSVVFKQDFFSLLDAAGGAASVSGGATSSAPPAVTDPQEQERFEFVSFVLDDVQDTWSKLLPERLGQPYARAQMVVFRDSTTTACGYGQAASGPFYCPGDQKVYLDLSFFDQLHRRFGAPGDFAQAYVIAHEVGHHVQQVLGIERQVRRMQRERRDLANDLSVRMELQADCLAGVWAHSTAQRDLLERGDIEEGLGAASAVGDDSIQRQTTGRVNPDSFTHGSAAQRVQWFRRGLESGDPDLCDTFSAERV